MFNKNLGSGRDSNIHSASSYTTQQRKAAYTRL